MARGSPKDPADDNRLDLVLWASGEELWDIDVASGRQVRQGRIPGLYHSDSEAGVSTSMQVFLSTVHPEDRGAVTAMLQQVIDGTRDDAELSYRVSLNSRPWVWLHSRGRAVARSPDGKATRLVGTTRDITMLKKNEERLGFALRAAGEELWEVDRHVEAIHRENPIAAIDYGSGDESMTMAGLGAAMHPDEVEDVTRMFRAVLAGETPEFNAAYRLRGKDDGYVWIQSQGRGLDPDEHGRPRRVLGMSRDITASKLIEQRLRLSLWGSRAELWDVHIASGVIERECSLAHLALPARAIRFDDLVQQAHEDDRPALSRSWVDHAKGLTDSFEAQYRLRDIDGHWRWVLARGRVTERTPEGWAVRVLGTLQDITEIKRAEEELRRLNEELEDRVAHRTADLSVANAELSRTVERLGEAQTQLVESEKMASLGSLVAGVAHEINTPLGISVTAASHLGEEIEALEKLLHRAASTNPEIDYHAQIIRQCADLILRNLDRADRLVKSFKQVAVDQSSEQLREIVLRDYIEEILQSLHPRIKRTTHRIDVECSPSIHLLTYPGAIYQTITNLVVNSLVHGFDGVEKGVIRIAASATADQVAIDYSDDGHGMSTEARRRVFDPFYTTRRGQGGTGLGMHIVYNLITQLLGGSIRCEGGPGAGARFEIRIPRVMCVAGKAPMH